MSRSQSTTKQRPADNRHCFAISDHPGGYPSSVRMVPSLSPGKEKAAVLAHLLDALVWGPVPSSECSAVCAAELFMGDWCLHVYQLSDGSRVIDAGDLAALLGDAS